VTNPLARGGGERILVVEDNALLRRIVVRQLVELDYRVLEAENAATALGLLAKERVDLVITDVVMPGGSDGIELARQVQQHWPMVKVVFTSGFPESQIDSRIHPLPNDALLLTKPYRKDELAAIVRNSLRGA
jgi:CheY-like chemotaxis protein